jgi:pSer/pThr/pTyr-binding forkhead associated (FHA) protein/tetratricopeptide (TPR) repeat protein
MGAAPILTLLKDGETIKSFSLEGEAMLGRAEGCVIRLEDRAISREHAILKPVTGGVQIEKKSPFAPLTVNGADCTRALIKLGDVVAIGPYLLKLGDPRDHQAQPQPHKEESQTKPEILEPPALELAQVAPPENAMPSVDDILATDGTPPATPLEFAQPENSPLELVPPTNDHAFQGQAIDLTAPPPAENPFAFQTSLENAPGGLAEESEHVSSGNISLEAPMQFQAPEASVPPPAPFQAQETLTPLEEASEDAVTRAISISKVEAKILLQGGKEFAIEKDEVIIGRAKDCDLSVDDRKASRRNSLVRRQGGRFFVRDLGSANGTHLNGVKLVDEVQISSDDIIRIGDAELIFQATSTAYADASFPSTSSISHANTGSYDGPRDLGNLGSEAPFPDSAVSVNPIGEVIGERLTSEFTGPIPPPGTPTPDGFIPGINDLPGASPSKGNLIEKYRALPPARKAIWTVIIIALFYFLVIEDDEPPVPPKKPVANAKQNATGETDPAAKKVALESLTPEQRKNLDTWHDLAFDYYKNREYDKSLFELGKVFALVPDYRDSREIERYAKEGKRQLEAREVERKQAEEEARVKARISQLVTEITDRMNRKQYPQARELFAEILTLDPDNEIVAKYSRELESLEEQRRMADQAKELSREVIARAREIYAEGLALKSRAKYHSAIGVFQRVIEINPADERLIAKARAGISSSRQMIADVRDPALAEGKQLEESGDLAKAFKAYERANRADPGHPAARDGMERIRGVLHERAKMLYTEAVLAESYSDFTVAKQKFQELVDTAPADDLYHQRAKRKLARYFVKDESVQ